MRKGWNKGRKDRKGKVKKLGKLRKEWLREGRKTKGGKEKGVNKAMGGRGDDVRG